MEEWIKKSDVVKALKPIAEQLSDGLQSDIASAIMSIPSVDRQQEWIPCSERLPRARESVLLAVNHKYGDWVGEGCYWETTDNHTIWKGYRWNATYWDDEIIAWMPLPEPWKGADDE